MEIIKKTDPAPDSFGEQAGAIRKIREAIGANTPAREKSARAIVKTFGCQQNENDSEKLKGMLHAMGYEAAPDEKSAGLIIINTCAIREHAETKVLGNVGALKKLKEEDPSVLIALCGCMMEEEHRREEILKKYRHVDMVFGPGALYKFPGILWEAMEKKVRVFAERGESRPIAEGIPQRRDSSVSAWVSIMAGCDNFCSYCVVPYVRGREKGREPGAVLEEIRGLVGAGYKDITLLGQNVNSYGKNLAERIDFSDLLQRAAGIPGEFWLRFMTSHPKDVSEKLLDVIRSSPNIAKHLHLPVQSGSDAVLAAMNRGYSREKYLSYIEKAKQIPEITLSTDVIVGFPGETEEDFEETLELLRRVRYDSLFSFIFSRRRGTPADKMANQVPEDVKKRRFQALCELQNMISREKNEALLGKALTVLVEGESKTDKKMLAGRTGGNKIVAFRGEKDLVGKFLRLKITDFRTWSLYGEIE